jgi:ribosome-binding protein aMBF1 (putative translation factor)
MSKKSWSSGKYIQRKREVIGQQIRTFQEKRGFSQDELAEIMDLNRTIISKVETGWFAFTIDNLLKFACYLDFSISVPEKQGK